MTRFPRAHFRKGGVMLLTVLFFIIMGIFVVGGASYLAAEDVGSANDIFQSGAQFYAAESGVEDALYRLKNNVALVSNTLVLDGKTAQVAVSTTSTTTTILSVSSTTSAFKEISAGLTTGAGTAFNYGIQAGTGGMYMDGGSSITGSVYANGSITALTGVSITGSATAAGTSTLGGNSYVGGVYVGTGSAGDAWAHEVDGGSVAGNLYCATGTFNNKSCNTSKGDAPAVAFPYTDANITGWKNAAAAGGTISGNEHIDYAGGTLGPKKITGNLLVDGGGTLTLTGSLWVVGNVTVTGGARIILPSNYGKNSETIVSDGLLDIEGGGSAGSGASGSYLFLVTTSNCTGTNCGGSYAATVTGGAGTIAVSAQKGGISLSGAASLEAATANYVYITGGSHVTYNSGLASPSFSDGPKGGYVVSSWQEL